MLSCVVSSSVVVLHSVALSCCMYTVLRFYFVQTGLYTTVCHALCNVVHSLVLKCFRACVLLYYAVGVCVVTLCCVRWSGGGCKCWSCVYASGGAQQTQNKTNFGMGGIYLLRPYTDTNTEDPLSNERGVL